MRVVITPTAEASLEEIYRYKCDYSIKQADEFLDEIYSFITQNLSEFPHLGHVYNEAQGLFRLVYRKGFNIDYQLGDETVFVLFVIDGALSFNQELADPDHNPLSRG